MPLWRQLTAACVLVGSLGLLPSGAAWAQCTATSATCVCGPVPAEGVLEGVILDAEPPLALFEVTAVHGDVGDYAIEDLIPLEWRGGAAEDIGLLLNLRGGEVVFRQPVGGDGQVVCAATGFRTPVADAVAAALSEDCAGALRELGFSAPSCEGEGGGGSAVGCAATPSDRAAGPVVLLAAGLAGALLVLRFPVGGG